MSNNAKPTMQELLARLSQILRALGPALQLWMKAKQTNTMTPTKPDTDTLGAWDASRDVNRHNVRVLCDSAGLSLVPNVPVTFADGTMQLYTPKDIICACIEVESDFQNYYIDGPKQGGRVIHENYMTRLDGTRVLASTDFGICQINDRYHIGPDLDFHSVEELMSDPAGAVKFMISMYKSGLLTLWVSFKAGEFKKFLQR